MRVNEVVSVTSSVDDTVRVVDSASEGVTRQKDLASLAIFRPGDLLETVPGRVATQHSGGGKANQYFVRGFNPDHGTDFRVMPDGVLRRAWSSRRFRYFGAKPLVEDDSVRWEASAFGTARIACQLPLGVQLGLEVFNLFDTEANDIDYFYPSRLPGELTGVDDVHFHPLHGRSVRVFVDWRF